MKNKLNEEKIRMVKLAGILNENNDAGAGVQVWFDMDGVLADFDKKNNVIKMTKLDPKKNKQKSK